MPMTATGPTVVGVSASDWSWFESALDSCEQRAGTAFVEVDHPVAEVAETELDTHPWEMAAEPGGALLEVSSALATGGPFGVSEAITDDRIAELLAEIIAEVTAEPSPLTTPPGDTAALSDPFDELLRDGIDPAPRTVGSDDADSFTDPIVAEHGATTATPDSTSSAAEPAERADSFDLDDGLTADTGDGTVPDASALNDLTLNDLALGEVALGELVDDPWLLPHEQVDEYVDEPVDEVDAGSNGDSLPDDWTPDG